MGSEGTMMKIALLVAMTVGLASAYEEFDSCVFEFNRGSDPAYLGLEPSSTVETDDVMTTTDEMNEFCAFWCAEYDCAMVVRQDSFCALYDEAVAVADLDQSERTHVYITNVRCGSETRKSLIQEATSWDCRASEIMTQSMPTEDGDWVTGFEIISLPQGDVGNLDLLCAAACHLADGSNGGQMCGSALRRGSKCELFAVEREFDVVENGATSFIAFPDCSPVEGRSAASSSNCLEFECDGQCYGSADKCDGYEDCVSGADEANCDGRSPDSTGCESGLFDCVVEGYEAHCVPEAFKCDGEEDCPNGADEAGCGGGAGKPADYTSPTESCSSEEHDCNKDGSECIPAAWKCDGWQDCQFVNEEAGCAGSAVTDAPTTTTTAAPTGPTTPATCNYNGCKCGQGVKSNLMRIVGGVINKAWGWPWLIDLQRDGGHSCGAALLRLSDDVEQSDIVITALHCVSDLQPGPLKVVAGQHSLSVTELGEQPRGVVGIDTPEYAKGSNGPSLADIAILKLESPIPFSAKIQPLCLPKEDQKFKKGDNFVVTGWGSLNSGGRNPDRPREVIVPYATDAVCGSDYPGRVNLTAEFCAGFAAGEKDSCQGDSGGPLNFKGPDNRWNLAGIVSWGDGCARPGARGLYTKVTTYLPWIKSTICRKSQFGSQISGC